MGSSDTRKRPHVLISGPEPRSRTMSDPEELATCDLMNLERSPPSLTRKMIPYLSVVGRYCWPGPGTATAVGLGTSYVVHSSVVGPGVQVHAPVATARVTIIRVTVHVPRGGRASSLIRMQVCARQIRWARR